MHIHAIPNIEQSIKRRGGIMLEWTVGAESFMKLDG